ncbi:hypothetical protein [Luteimonas suaedae]|uniref:hypothetical protein n=1 Tax=Luteimonas suaedae TaxID=2605430 RepID=UPI0011EECEC3|nr:hypothetical protein [Luteimonas suaedae]
MKPLHRHLAPAALAAALVSLSGHASPPSSSLQRAEAAERRSADLLPDPLRQRLSMRIRDILPDATTAKAVSPDDVGDADSFGRALKWLGSAQMNIDLADSCPAPVPGTTVGSACAPLQPLPAFTSFTFDDVARITLPKDVSHSLLCHWFSPYLGIVYGNPNPPGGAPIVAWLWYQPTLTIENAVLGDPAMIDPTTGLPFNGRLTTSVTSFESFEVPLPADTQIAVRERDTATCIGGFVSRRALVQIWGLTESQAWQFFKHPTTIRMNISGGAQYVASANMIFGLRVIGD